MVYPYPLQPSANTFLNLDSDSSIVVKTHKTTFYVVQQILHLQPRATPAKIYY